jgi:transcriptional regulator with XRE-family HTH domain
MTARRKLAPEDVLYIRLCERIRRETPTARQLAQRLGVSTGTVQQIERGTRYKDVRMPHV